MALGCNCNATGVGSILTRGNESLFLNILISSFWRQGKMPALSTPTQHQMPRKIRRKVENGVSYHYVSSAHPAVCEIQREADYYN